MAKLWGIPAVMTLHGEVSRCYGKWVCRGRCDGVVAVSAQAQQSFLDRHRGLPTAPIQVIENGILLATESGNNSEARAALGIADATVLTTVARLVALKDIGTLLRAFERCSPGERNLLLLLVGDGECRQELETLAGELGIAPRVRFMGFRDDIEGILSASDLFVLSSLTEGMPLSVLEAMAAGLPVVATRVGGVPELVTDGETGLLVAPKDPEALAAALLSLIEDRSSRLRMGRAARARIEESFSFTAMLDQYETFYAGTLRG
jgi:glycosyltransferase involved in cell wall biosynthesis